MMWIYPSCLFCRWFRETEQWWTNQIMSIWAKKFDLMWCLNDKRPTIGKYTWSQKCLKYQGARILWQLWQRAICQFSHLFMWKAFQEKNIFICSINYQVGKDAYTWISILTNMWTRWKSQNQKYSFKSFVKEASELRGTNASAYKTENMKTIRFGEYLKCRGCKMYVAGWKFPVVAEKGIHAWEFVNREPLKSCGLLGKSYTQYSIV